MPHHLKRLIGQGDLHFITFCCYHRRRLLATAHARNIALQVLREVRAKYDFALIGYVFMPDHMHLLIGEPPAVPPATVMQVFKQRVSRRLRKKKRAAPAQLRLQFDEVADGERRFWQRRYFDFNVYSQRKIIEKLHYMHANPVKEKLVTHPGKWPWSSWCHYYARDALLAMDAWDAPSKSASVAMDSMRQRKSPPFAKYAKGRPPDLCSPFAIVI